MFGAIIGDVVGSTRERSSVKSMNFELFPHGSRFTDDTIMSVATAYAILTGEPYSVCYKKFGRKYRKRGYGKSFGQWIDSDSCEPYNSWGNGSAMRVAPVGWAFNNIKDVLREAKKSAECTHNHPEGIKGAKAVALCIYLARNGKTKKEIKEIITKRFCYDLDRKISSIRKTYKFDVSCQGSVPEAIIAFLDSENMEDAVRLAISLGGDADTQASIAGAIAEAFYRKAPVSMIVETSKYIPKEFIYIVDRFYKKFVEIK